MCRSKRRSSIFCAMCRRKRADVSVYFARPQSGAAPVLGSRCDVPWATRRACEDGNAVRKPLHPYTQALIAAIPRPPDAPSLPDACGDGVTLGYRPRPLLLGGDPPSLMSPPSGCAFHPRCRRYEEAGRPAICRQERPKLVTISVGKPGDLPSQVACHLQNQTKPE